MGWTVEVKTDVLDEKLDTLAESAADLTVPLRMFGGYLKRRARARYDAQNFTPLAAATRERRERRAVGVMENKLKRELRGAERRARKKQLDEAAGPVEETSGIRNRRAVLEAFRREHGRGLLEAAEFQPLSVRQAASLKERTARQVVRSTRILGALGRSLYFEVGEGKVTLTEGTAAEWSEVQNDGGTVGNGAQLPARTIVVLEANDLEVLRSILKSRLLMPFEEGLHGPGF